MINMEVFEKLKKYLRDNQVKFKEIHHQPTRTSQEAANARGEEVRIGGKALVMKLGKEFKLLVISAARKMDSRMIKDYFNVKRTRFANQDELLELTGLVPGSIPPFGRPILDLDLYLDESITRNNRIAFNAGSLTDSIIMDIEDYLRLAQPQIIKFSSE